MARVLIVDDDPATRSELRKAVESCERFSVVGEAGDGDDALRLVQATTPDLVTLDLEMPRMDGFTLLRLLVTRFRIPVLVVSGYTHKQNVFRALELGAVECIQKPAGGFSHARERAHLCDKLELVKRLGVAAHAANSLSDSPLKARSFEIKNLVAIAASAGGPASIQALLDRLPASFPAAIVIAQHMPAAFTGQFASRLNRSSALCVKEAQNASPLMAGHAYVCPGGSCLTVDGPGLSQSVARLRAPDRTDRYVPSADALFVSVSQLAGRRAIGVVLTGMGDDGTLGAGAIASANGLVLTQLEQTATMPGMPESVRRAGVPHRSLPIPALGDLLRTLVGT